MANRAIERAGQTGAAQGTEQAHTLIVLVNDRPGSVDRVVGLLRRRRANMQTLILGRSIQPDVVRITMSVDDSQVGVDHLVEQLRKIVDVVQVTNLSAQEAILRELALIKVNATGSRVQEVLAYGQQFDARIVDITHETVTLEIVGNEERIEQLLECLKHYGIGDVARSGCIAMSRGER
ncbi:MAG: acetolactate synthase small subunit [Ktedonobacteraceae bacterium]